MSYERGDRGRGFAGDESYDVEPNDFGPVPGKRPLTRLLRKARGAGSVAGKPAANLPSAGAPLGEDLRARFEPRLGGDLSSVTVNTGPEAARAAEDLGARAF